MQAAFIESYGDPADVVQVGELPDPLLGPDGVLIEVGSAGINPVDWKIVAGYLQPAFPHGLPLIPGWDVAGRVAAVGPAVTTVAVGDRVAAYARKDHVQHGTFAQLVAVRETAVAPVPDAVPIAAAGALPLAGLTAEQCLDAAGVGPGDVVLVHAAAGGVGSFATQLALLRGATVFGTASAGNHDALAAAGVIPLDYRQDLGAQLDGRRADVVVDLVGGPTLAATPDLTHPGSRVVSITDAVAVAQLGADHDLEPHYVFVRPDAPQLRRLLDLVADGSLIVAIAASFPLADTAAALTASMTGHTRGKLVLDVATLD